MKSSWKNPLKVLPVLLLLAAYAGAAFGVAGNVQFVIGDVKLINKAGESQALQKGAAINEGDRIVTADGASAQIKMVDGGFIAIRPNTDMGFDTYRYSGKEDGTESAVVSLLRGGFRTITGIIGRTNKQNYLVKTATATIGIRGTDHEPMVILAPQPGQVAIAAAGTYDKVNVGIAYIRTDAGSVDIQRNQVGFAPVSRAAPVILPRIPSFYKPTPAPGPQKAAAPGEKAAEASAQTRNTAVVDPTSTISAAPAAATVAAAPAAVAPVVAVTATNASGNTVNTTTQTVTTSSGTEVPITQAMVTPTGTVVPITPTVPVVPVTPAPIITPTYSNPAVASGNFTDGLLGMKPVPGGVEAVIYGSTAMSAINGSPTAPTMSANTNYVLDASKSIVEIRNIGYYRLGWNYSGPAINNADITFSGGTAKDLASDPNGLYYFGRWQGGQVNVKDLATTGAVAPFTDALGPTSVHWFVGLLPGNSTTAGGPINNTQLLVGTANYSLAAATHPTDSLGNVGTLNSATLAANFSSQTVNAALGLTFSSADPVNVSTRNLIISATANNVPILGAGFYADKELPYAPVIYCTGSSCATAGYSGSIGGAFLSTASAGSTTGAVGTGAALGYSFRPSMGSALAQLPFTDFIQGVAVLSTGVAPTPGPPVPTGGPFAAYAPNNIAIDVASQFFLSQIGSGSLVAPADLAYVGGGLSSFTDRDIGGGGSQSYSVIGGSTPVTANATSFATTGVQFGRWSSATAQQASFTNPLGAQSGAPTTWIYGPQGYLDTPVVPGSNTGPLTGTFSYALDGSTAPYDRQSRTSGTLTSASISANFTNQTASASLALTVGGQAWSAATPTPVSFFSSNMFFASSSSPSGTGNDLTVSMGAGTPAACPTCYGSLRGAFTGQNYAGAILSYNLGDNGNAGGDIVGHAALYRQGTAITNGTTPATGKYFVGDQGGGIQLVDTLSTPGGVLTAYGSGSSTSGFSSTTTVTCTTCTVTAATNAATSAAPTGVYFGTWDAGSYTNTWGGSLFGGSSHWITGPEAGPLFLANALIGTKSFAFDGGMVTNSAGVTGTVLGTTALTVDFTRQVAGINIDLSINDTAPTPTLHTWNAKTPSGGEAIINGGKGIGGAAFQASSYNGSGPGLLTVMVDGTTPGNGNVSGQLTGTGLNGAIISYDLFANVGGVASSTFEQVNGVAAFLGSTSDVATAHRSVMISATDPSSIINQPVLGFYVNNPTRMLTDVAGNLTQFDMSQINDHGNGNNKSSQTLSSGTSVLTDQGSDPITGISWGRWAGGSINITNRIDGTIKTQPLAGSLHWIAGLTETAAVTLPLSGTFTYVNAGGTAPTDNLGNVGTLNSATLTANFTAQTVNVGVQTTIAGASLGGSANAVPILQRTVFAAGPDMPVNVSVTCTGACGTTHRGTIIGGFSGAGATGAGMMYSLEKVGGANASITSGVVGFHR